MARTTIGQEFSALPTIELGSLIGVAGTWTSLAAIAQHLPEYSRDRVHGHRMSRESLARLIETLSRMTVAETADLPALDPKRAPVILAGALVAEGVMDTLNVDEVVVSEHDTLDGLAREVLALP